MCARLFDHRVKSLFSDLLMSPSHPIGHIRDYFYRTEFQHRGSPHIHCLIWIHDAPKIGEVPDTDICAFIDKYVTCELPDENLDPDLYEKVTSVQVHSKNHSKSCKKHSKTCRFHFPRPPIKTTFIAKVDSENDAPKPPQNPSEKLEEFNLEEFQKLCDSQSRTGKQILTDVWTVINSLQSDSNLTIEKVLSLANVKYEQFQEALRSVSTRNTVFYKRSLNDLWVNNYNKELLSAWNANLDIQYITDAYACVAYILSYISKAETEMGDLLLNAKKEAEEGNTDVAATMKIIGKTYMQNREISAQEAVYRVCSLHLKQCTRKVTFIPTGSKPLKMSLPINVIRSRKDEDENIWMSSVIDKYYARPSSEEFETMCLADFCSKYSILPASMKPKKSKQKDQLPVHELQRDLGYLKQKRIGKEHVIRYPRFNRVKQPEEYYMTQLQLYFPHRSVDFKPPTCPSYEEYLRSESVINIVNLNRKRFEIDSEDLENAWNDMQEGRIREDAWSLIAPESELERLELESEREQPNGHVDGEVEEIPELSNAKTNGKSKTSDLSVQLLKPVISHQQMYKMMGQMNGEQLQVFYKIRKWCLNVSWNQNPPPFHVFLTGGAGTGKTHLIKCIHYEASRILSKLGSNPDAHTVLLTAPTGTAAFNMDGNTLHSALSLNKGLRLPYVPLAENTLNSLRTRFESLRILIIDEISMVDHKILAYIHGRLSQLKQSKQIFGNISILAVGDFCQIPPIKASPLFRPKSSNFVDLWTPIFSVSTLTEIMRQKNDASFAEMLNRLRTRCRDEPLQQKDLEMLSSRTCDKLPDEALQYLHLCPVNDQVTKHNTAMVKKICDPVHTIFAIDYAKNYTTGELQKRATPYFTKNPDDLLSSLEIGINARVMLVRNLDTEDGLVNGAFGTVKGFDKNTADDVVVVYVQFDNPRSGKKHMLKSSSKCPLSRKYVQINRLAETLHGRNVTRRQFPFKLGWAATIHKTQGMTMDNVVVSMKGIFLPGMAYVALSRAKTLSGLHIINFDPNVIYAAPDIVPAVGKMQPFIEKLPEVQSETNKHFTVVLLNVEGLIPHLNDVKSSKNIISADVLCFTETWLKKNQNLPRAFLPAYSVKKVSRSECYDNTHKDFKDLASMDRGGVAVLVKNDVIYSMVDMIVPNIECIVCTVEPSFKMTITLIYRPPVYPIGLFSEQLTLLLSKLDLLKHPHIVLGDFNDDTSKPSGIKDVFRTFGYCQIVDMPTTEAGTCLDNAYVKGFVTLPKAKVVDLYYSFHEAVQIDLQM